MNKKILPLLTIVSRAFENDHGNLLRDINNYIYNEIKYEKNINWDNIVVYIDLKIRGRNPIKGPIDKSWYISKSSNKIDGLVYVLNENSLVNPKDFFEVLELSKRMRIQLIIAIVDMYGDITYYTLSEVSLMK